MDLALLQSLLASAKIPTDVLFPRMNNLRTGVAIDGYNDAILGVLYTDYPRARDIVAGYISRRKRTNSIPIRARFRNLFELVVAGAFVNAYSPVPEVVLQTHKDRSRRTLLREGPVSEPSPAPREPRRTNRPLKVFAWLFGSVVAIDTLTKVLAFLLLAPGDYYPVFGDSFGLYVIQNSAIGAATLINGLLGSGDTAVVFLFNALTYLLFAAGVGFGWRLPVRKIFKVFIVVGITIGASVLSRVLATSFPHLHPDPKLALTVLRVSVLSLIAAAFSVSRRMAPRCLWTCLAAAAFSNLIGFFYPPFSVIDFLIVNAISIDFNLADLTAILCTLALVCYGAILLVKAVRGRRLPAGSLAFLDK